MGAHDPAPSSPAPSSRGGPVSAVRVLALLCSTLLHGGSLLAAAIKTGQGVHLQLHPLISEACQFVSQVTGLVGHVKEGVGLLNQLDPTGGALNADKLVNVTQISGYLEQNPFSGECLTAADVLLLLCNLLVPLVLGSVLTVLLLGCVVGALCGAGCWCYCRLVYWPCRADMRGWTFLSGHTAPALLSTGILLDTVQDCK